MAATTGFKQQCPHCEAIVPVKDEGLIGKRIRCPKCGEPFLLEDPEGSAKTTKSARPAKGKAAAAASSAKAKAKSRVRGDEDDDEPKFKKKKSNNNVLIIGGLALAGVAVILLAVAFFFMNSGDTKKGGGGSGIASNNNNRPAEEPPKEDPKTTTPVASTLVLGNVSNLLPNDTQFVVNVPMPDVLKNPLGQMLFDNYAASTKGSDSVLGFAFRDVERWLITMKITDPGWTFLVWRTQKPINFEATKRGLQLKPAKAEGSPIQGQEFYSTTVNWLESSKLLPYYLKPEGDNAAAGDQKQAPLYVYKRDDQTLIIANLLPLKEFLAKKGQPSFKDTTAAPPKEAGAAGDGASTLPGTLPGAGRGGRSTFPGSAGQAPARASGDYRTINPRLKALMDEMEANTPVLVSAAVDVEGDPVVEATMLANGKKEKFNGFGFSFQWKQEIMTATAAVECGSDQDATNVRNDIQKQIQTLATALKPFGIDIKSGRERRPEPQQGQQPGQPGGPERGPGGLPLPGRPRDPGGLPGLPGGRQPGNPNDPKQPVEKGPRPPFTLAYELNVRGKTFTAVTDIKLRDDVYEEAVKQVEPYLVRLQGELEMASARPHPQRLADAGRLYTEDKKQYPLGTLKRDKSSARAGRRWNPDQRISWMADLLPFLGYERAHSRIVPEKSWRDPENLTTASILVPEFVDANAPKSKWYISYPGVPTEVAATHYVGMAGIGLDAPYYRVSDPAVADKLGIFGYDRVTPLGDVLDKAKTILMIQVPPTLHSPWMAGGGSTVRGVPETNSIAPFVTVNGDRQRGTTVIMADGSVHWLSEKTSDDVFKALCRVKGRKSDVKASELRAVPPPDDGPELKTTNLPTTPPKAGETKPAPAASVPPPGK